MELSRCLFFNRGFSREKLEHIAQALSVVLPGVDFLLLLPDDIGGIYISASSAAAAEDASVQQMLKSRAPLDLYANCILYLPPTPRNECFHYNAETAAAAAEAYRQQLRSPPTAEFVSKLKNEREEFVRQGKRHWGAVEDEAEEGKEKREEEAMQVMGVLNVCNSPFECSSELKAVNEKISQEEPIRGKHFSPCTLFPSHPVCAQLINQYACGRWKFSLWAPGTNKVEAVPQKQEEEENANRETEEDKVYVQNRKALHGLWIPMGPGPVRESLKMTGSFADPLATAEVHTRCCNTRLQLVERAAAVDAALLR